MKNVIYKSVIILSGVLLSVIKYNGFNIWELEFNTLTILFIFFTITLVLGIVLYNYNLNNKIAISTTPENNISEPEIYINEGSTNSIKDKFLELSERTKYYLIVICSSLLFITYLGFKFKRFNNVRILKKAARKNAKWQRDTYMDSVTVDDSFFTLKGYDFNWELFIISFLLIIVFAYIIRNTIYYDKIKKYIKEIKRS